MCIAVGENSQYKMFNTRLATTDITESDLEETSMHVSTAIISTSM
jgi:hypothetical protein